MIQIPDFIGDDDILSNIPVSYRKKYSAGITFWQNQITGHVFKCKPGEPPPANSIKILQSKYYTIKKHDEKKA